MERQSSAGSNSRPYAGMVKTDGKAKDLLALTAAGVAGLIAIALLLLAFYLFVQERPKPAPSASATDAVTAPTAPAGSKSIADRVPGEEDLSTGDPELSASGSKQFTDRLPGEDDPIVQEEDVRPAAEGAKKFTDRIIGEQEIKGE